MSRGSTGPGLLLPLSPGPRARGGLTWGRKGAAVPTEARQVGGLWGSCGQRGCSPEREGTHCRQREGSGAIQIQSVWRRRNSPH